LINEYPGRVPFYHLDLFRLEQEKEAEDLGLEDYLQSGGIIAIEWADKIPSLLPEEMFLIYFAYTGTNARTLEITGKGKRFEDLVKALFEIRLQNSPACR
jgi:tRNA threonylcarbamoyladenosine biosynthesis protein TsaE